MLRRSDLITETHGRALSSLEVSQYLEDIIPSIFAVVFSMNQNIRHQVLWAVRDELSAWGGLNQKELERRVTEGYRRGS